MAKMKIFELKNYINENTNKSFESKDLQDFLVKSMGVKKTHSSGLEENEVQAIKNHFIPAKPVAASTQVHTESNRRPTAGDIQRNIQSQRAMEQNVAHASSHTDSGNRPLKSNTETRPMDQRPNTAGNARQGQQSQYQGQRPANQSGVRQGQQGQQGQYQGQRDQGQRTGNQGGMRQGQQGQQGQYQTGRMTGEESSRNGLGQRMGGQGGMMQGQPGQQGQFQEQTPVGDDSQRSGIGQHSTNQGGMRQGQSGQYQGQRDSSQRPSDNQRSYGQGGQRQGQQGQYQGQRDNSQRPYGQGGNRQGGYNQQGQGQYQGQRDQGQRDQGQRSGDNNQRPYSQGGNRQGGYNQQGQQGQQSQRPYGQGNGVRSGGTDQGYQRSSYQGNRPAGGDGQRSGQRPYGQNNGYNNQNRPRPNQEDGQRQGGFRSNTGDGQRQGGFRPNTGDGQRQGGYRSNTGGGQGQNRGGFGGNSNYSRPAGSGQGQRTGGYQGRGFESGFNKDEDDKPNYGNRSGQGGNGNRKPGAGKGGERKNFDQQILDQKVAEKNDFSNKRNRDRINKEKNYKEKSIIGRDIEEDNTIKSKVLPKKGQFIKPKPIVAVKEDIKTIVIPEVLTIKELADKMKMPSAVLIKKLFLAGKMVSLNQEITFEEAEEIALEYEIIAEKEVKINEVEELLKEEEEDPAMMKKRPPVVCVMGHVDHGKTSLLDAIRTTNVTSREAGGITQHIGAYIVEINGEKIAFLDTPGHEAFTSMRMRGAKSTDIAILVVAADDGVMPQTIEAINHAKAAGVQIIVAINKIDKPSANVERVKQELTEYELVAEDWGGDTIFVPVSAHTREGIDHLLEMILLTAEIAELKADPDRLARGIVIEAELDKGRGPVATILVQKGTLRVGDNVAVGASYGKVRAMMDDKGRRVKEALPSTPVEILGLNEVPDAGETFLATESEKEARTIAEAFISQGKEKLIADTKAKLSLDGLFSQIKAGNIKELNLIIKADVQGSVEAMKQSLIKLSNDEVAVRIIHGGVGAINESDVILASASNAIIIGFNVRPDNAAKETADREKVDVKLYRVIYTAINDVEAAMKGMLDPIFEEKVIGHAEIRQTFKASGIGTIAGSYVLDGKIQRGCKARIYRDDVLVFEGILASLKRFQDDVKEVATGYECGLVFEKFNDVKEFDKVELYIMAEVPR